MNNLAAVAAMLLLLSGAASAQAKAVSCTYETKRGEKDVYVVEWDDGDQATLRVDDARVPRQTARFDYYVNSFSAVELSWCARDKRVSPPFIACHYVDRTNGAFRTTSYDGSDGKTSTYATGSCEEGKSPSTKF